MPNVRPLNENKYHMSKDRYDELRSRCYDYRGQRYRNLVPLCHDCHDRAHERMKYKKKKQVNEERW